MGKKITLVHAPTGDKEEVDVDELLEFFITPDMTEEEKEQIRKFFESDDDPKEH